MYEEGGPCPECETGKLEYPVPENCSCHIDPPCSACVEVQLTCGECGWENEEYK